MAMKIITNNVPRDVLSFYELTEKQRAEFDYFDAENDVGMFFRYRGEVYDLDDGFDSVKDEGLRGWDAVQPDSFFSGICIRFTEDFEQVVVGRYYT